MSENRPSFTVLALSILVAGILLLLLLPIGTLAGTTSLLFTGIFTLHLTALFVAVTFALLTISDLYRSTSTLFRGAIVIALASLLLSLLESTLPVTFRDSLIHHLAVPQWWIERGAIFSPSWHEWSFYPMLINLGFAGLISFGLEGLTGSYNWLLTLLFCSVVAQGTARVTENRESAVIALLISATLPIIHRLAPLPTADIGLALFSAITFFSLLESFCSRARDNKIADQPLLFAGAALGLALGTKYNALPFALASGLFALLIYAKRGTRHALRSTLIVAVTAVAIYSPWLLRNFVLTSNPIYPLYSNIFKPSIERPAGLPNLKPLEQRLLIYQETPIELALLPLRIFLQGKDDQPAKFDGALSPLLLLGLLSYACFKKKDFFTFSIGVSLLVIILSIFLNPLRIRYLAPILAPLILMCAQTISTTLKKGVLLKGATLCALGVHLLLFSHYALGKALKETLIGYLTGEITKDQYLEERIGEYPLVEYINQHVRGDKTLYLLFTGNRFALYKPQTFSGGHYSASVLIDWIRKSEQSRKPLLQFFREHPIDYLVADSQRAQQFVTEQLNAEERSVWSKFVEQHLRFIHEQRGFSLWQVVD